MPPKISHGRSPLRQPTGPWELLLGILALVSVGIFIVPYLGALHLAVSAAAYSTWVVPLDIAICVVFAADYLIRMGRSNKGSITFARENFLQPFAMIPLSTPIIRSVEVFLIIIVAARFVRAFNVVFGQQAFQSILRRYSGVLAREISDAVLVRSMATAREVAARGRFARWVGDAIDRRRPEVHMIVAESMEKLPAWQTFRRLPGAEDIVAKGEDLVVDLLIETMRSERLNILVANVIDDSIEEFEKALEEKHPGIMVDALGPDAEGHSMYGEMPRRGGRL